MRLFGRVRSGQNKRPEPFSTPQSVDQEVSATQPRRLVLGSPKDRYGMVNCDEKEMPSPAYNGVQAVAVTGDQREPAPTVERIPEEPTSTTADDTGGETEEELREDANDSAKKKNKKVKKKKKKGKKKKKKHPAPDADVGDDDSMPIVILDRVPTAMEYESDDSIEKMMDERSRYSRYTTEYDELDLEPFDDVDSENETDKYAGAGTIGQIVSIMSDDSQPAVWRSFDEEEEKKKKSEKKKKAGGNKSSKKTKSQEDKEDASTQDQSGVRSKPSGHSAIRSKPSGTEMSGKSKGSRKKKYQDLREFRKTHSTDSKPKASRPTPVQNLEAEVYAPYTLPDYNEPSVDQGSQHESSSHKQTKGTTIVKKGSADQADNNSRRSQNSKAGSQNSTGSKRKNKTSTDAEVPVSQSQSWIAYETLSGTFDRSKTSLPPVMSDTSSLTDPLKKQEKYTALMAKQPTIKEEISLPREIAASTKPPMANKEAIRTQSLIRSFSTSKDTASASGVPVHPVHEQALSIASSGSSDKLQNRYSIPEQSPASAGKATWAPSPRSNDRMNKLEKRLGEINEAHSGSTVSSSGVRRSKNGTKLLDRYTEIKEDHSNNIEGKTSRSSPKNKGIPLSKQQNDRMYNQSLINEEELSYSTDSASRPRGEKTKKGQMKELDEYSVAISVQDDPALVQCLRFYQCAAAASIAGFATGWFPSGNAVKKEVKMLGRETEFDEVDKMRYRDSDVPPMVAPQVEVILENEEESFLNGENMDDATVDAPDLKAVEPNVNSYLREVTSLSLRLDDSGVEKKRQQPALDRGRAMAAEEGADLNITEISIPHTSSIKIQKRLAQQNQDEDLQSSSDMENRDTVNVQDNSMGTEEATRQDESNETAKPEEYAPAIEVIDKKNSGSTEESSKPASKKGISKLFYRFGRKAKKSMNSSGSASE